MNWLLGSVGAALLVAVFPGPDVTLLAPIALAPLLLAMARESRPLYRFLIGWVAGVVYWAGVCYWIRFVLATYGGLPGLGSWGAFLLFCLAKGLHMGVFGLLVGYLMPRWWAVPAVGALWVAIERTHGPLGFAWLALGNAGADMSVPMRLAPFTGVYGLSFVFAMMSAAVALVLLRRPRREILWLLALPLLYLLPPLPDFARPEESAVVVQPNVEADKDWTAESTREFHERLVYLSLSSALDVEAGKTRLVLWPELPAPLYYESDPEFRRKVTGLARLAQTYVLFGAVAFTPDGRPLNSAQLVSPAGEPVDRYDKMFLVPFGEFVPPPFGFIHKITREPGDAVPGTRLVTFPIGERRIGAFICYEVVFPHLVRRFAAQGAELFVNLSNDGYFGRSAAREQHLKIARMRAAENGRWLVRATNTGVTVTIDPAGRLVRRLPPDRETAARLGFSYRTSRTLYTRCGDWFVWVCAAMSLIALAAAWKPRNRGRVQGA